MSPASQRHAPADRSSRAPGSEQPLSRHLIGLSTAIRARVSEGLLARGHSLSPASTQVLPNLPLEGLGMSELAQRLRLTLQRTGQLVRDLEADGYVERRPDPRDGRAKRVVYTARGRRLVRDSEALVAEVSEAFASILGERRFRRLCLDLATLDAEINGVDTPLRIISAQAPEERKRSDG